MPPCVLKRVFGRPQTRSSLKCLKTNGSTVLIFVPITLFASLTLLWMMVWFARRNDLRLRAHQLFLATISLYALQSILITLRWGYAIDWAARPVAFVAPVLPVLLYLAYSALNAPLTLRRLWPLVATALCWVGLLFWPDLADVLILLCFLSFGGLLVVQSAKGADHIALTPLGAADKVILAMKLSGAVLILSGLADVFILFDFITNEGRHTGLIVSLLQAGFIMIIGFLAAFGQISENEHQEDIPIPDDSGMTEEDAGIVTRLEALFAVEGLHRDEDLNLRRLSRRLSLPDRRVSNAINRYKGQSVSQFVNEFRIKEACEQLKESNATVLAISLAVGFASKSNFNREFLRVTGVSPTQWRAANARKGVT